MKEQDSIPPSENPDLSEEQQNKSEEQRINEIAEELRNLDDSKNPEWDGSEAEFVEDDDSAEYEIPETGIKLSYVLTQDEMYRCLYHSNTFKTKGARAVVQSIILAVAAVIFFIAYFMSDNQYGGYNIFFGIVSLVMIAVIWVVPHLHMKSMAKLLADGKTIETEIYPTHIDIGRDDGAWSIELDGSSEIEEFDNIFMIYTQKGQNFAIPERVIEPEIYNDIRAILMSGTKPKDDEE
ncbi:MAG: YcxB family protein [Clostridia bacterium]|nr:YcxB family protein [Clostridia bacterium]